MSNTILHKRSATAASVPTYAALTAGEIAVNTADGKLFTKKGASDVSTFLPQAEITAFVGGVMQGGNGLTVSTVAGDFTSLNLTNLNPYSNPWAGSYSKVAEGYLNNSLSTVHGLVGGTATYNTTLTVTGTNAGTYAVDNASAWYRDAGGILRAGVCTDGYSYMAYTKAGAYILWDAGVSNYRLFTGTFPADGGATSATFYSATATSYAEYTGVFAGGRRISQGGASWAIAYPLTGGNSYAIYRRADSAYSLIYYTGLNAYIVAAGDWSGAGSHGSLSYNSMNGNAGADRGGYFSPVDGSHTSYALAYIQSIIVSMPSSLDAGTF